METLGRFWGVLDASGEPFRDVLEPFGRFGGVLEGCWEASRGILGRLGSILEAPWEVWSTFGRICIDLGSIFGKVLGPKNDVKMQWKSYWFLTLISERFCKDF